LNQEERQYGIATPAARANAPVVFVPTVMVRENQNALTNMTPPSSLPGSAASEDQERAFRDQFKRYVIAFVKEFRKYFPYKQTIRWSMEYGNNNEYSLIIFVKPPRSMNNH
jgi:hypothetical protein